MLGLDNTLIGHLTEVTGSTFVAQTLRDEQGFIPEVQMGTDKIKIGQVGSYLAVQQGQMKILTMVESMWLEQDETHRPIRKIRMIPLGEIKKNGGFERGIDDYPTTGAELHLVGASQLKGMFNKFNEAGYNVGRLSSMDSMEVFLDPSSLFGRHVAILGQSGSGKSWSVTSLIQSVLRAMPNAHIIMLDIAGEYCKREHDPNTHHVFPEHQMRSLDTRELEIPYWLLTFAELLDLLVDPLDPHASVQTAYLRDTIFELKNKANKDLNIGHITVDSPVAFSLAELYMRVKQANEHTSDFGKTKSPLNGKFDQFLVKLHSRFNDSRYDFLFKPKKRKTSDSLPGLMRDLVGLGEKRANVTVIDLSPVPWDVKPTVTAQVGRLAFEFNYWNPNFREFPIFLLCEEAHNYIPRERPGDDQFKGTRKVMERIAKEGRKYGVGLGVVSQRPADLSQTLLAQCANYICFRITSPEDQDYVRQLVPDAARGILDSLASLARGEAIAMGEAVPLPLRFRVTLPDPPPNSTDINYGKQWKTGPEDMSVEDLVDRWRHQTR